MGVKPDKFAVIADPGSLNYDENRRVIRCIWGEAAEKNGQRMKECRYIMIKRTCTIPDATAEIAHLRATGPVKAMETMQQESDRMDRSVYISANSYINKAFKYNSHTLFQLKNICIDIDSHNSPIDAVCDSVNTLFAELVESHDTFCIPLPNAVVYTGRGLQCWYYLHSTSAKLSFLARAIADNLCDSYEALLASMPITFAELSVDRGAAINQSGCFRAPGTYNPSAHCYSQGYLLSNDRWDINELKDAVGVVLPEKKPKHTQASAGSDTRNHGSNKRSDNSDYARLLLGFLCSLAESGSYESREVLCHIYHAKLLAYGIPEDEAADKVYEFNILFDTPLRDKELRALIRCNEMHRYHYSEAGMFEKIGVPHVKVNEYYAAKEALKNPRDYKRENRSRDLRSYMKRIEWHNEIRELALQGKSPKEIHDITGRAEATIKKYIGTPMETLDDFGSKAAIPEPAPERARKEIGDDLLRCKIESYRNQGFRSATAIAAILDVDEVRVQTIFEEYHELSQVKQDLHSTQFFLKQYSRELNRLLDKIPANPENQVTRMQIRHIQSEISVLQKKMEPYIEQNKTLPKAMTRETREIRHQTTRLKKAWEKTPVAS